jgi:succinyl-CoA synthetase beta subunit
VEIEEVHPNEKQQLTSFNVQLFKNLEQQNMKGYITIFGFHQKFIKTSKLKGSGN